MIQHECAVNFDFHTGGRRGVELPDRHRGRRRRRRRSRASSRGRRSTTTSWTRAARLCCRRPGGSWRPTSPVLIWSTSQTTHASGRASTTPTASRRDCSSRATRASTSPRSPREPHHPLFLHSGCIPWFSPSSTVTKKSLVVKHGERTKPPGLERPLRSQLRGIFPAGTGRVRGAAAEATRRSDAHGGRGRLIKRSNDRGVAVELGDFPGEPPECAATSGDAPRCSNKAQMERESPSRHACQSAVWPRASRPSMSTGASSIAAARVAALAGRVEAAPPVAVQPAGVAAILD